MNHPSFTNVPLKQSLASQILPWDQPALPRPAFQRPTIPTDLHAHCSLGLKHHLSIEKATGISTCFIQNPRPTYQPWTAPPPRHSWGCRSPPSALPAMPPFPPRCARWRQIVRSPCPALVRGRCENYGVLTGIKQCVTGICPRSRFTIAKWCASRPLMFANALKKG